NYPIVTIPDGKACSVTTHTANEAFNVLVQYCGASLRQDEADKRVLGDVKNGAGSSGENTTTTNAKEMKRSWYGIIDSQNDKGGYPTLTATDEEIARAATDTDGDGIPDYYEDLFGLDSDDASDGNAKTLDPQGLYTNLEIYLHYLVKDITKAQTATGSYAEIK
ncbi:MAG: pectate lyase, partial [Alistipes sp.]|nr:pectate lyase [Alistipes sp.]